MSAKRRYLHFPGGKLLGAGIYMISMLLIVLLLWEYSETTVRFILGFFLLAGIGMAAYPLWEWHQWGDVFTDEIGVSESFEFNVHRAPNTKGFERTMISFERGIVIGLKYVRNLSLYGLEHRGESKSGTYGYVIELERPMTFTFGPKTVEIRYLISEVPIQSMLTVEILILEPFEDGVAFARAT